MSEFPQAHFQTCQVDGLEPSNQTLIFNWQLKTLQNQQV